MPSCVRLLPAVDVGIIVMSTPEPEFLIASRWTARIFEGLDETSHHDYKD